MPRRHACQTSDLPATLRKVSAAPIQLGRRCFIRVGALSYLGLGLSDALRVTRSIAAEDPDGVPRGEVLYLGLAPRRAEPVGQLGRERQQRLQADCNERQRDPGFGSPAPNCTTHGQAVDHSIDDVALSRPPGWNVLCIHGPFEQHHNEIS